jgi:uncharacterized protein (DUF58 family)
MPFLRRIADWLETRWVAPAYSGWLLGSLFIFFFVAATNTLAGWLYVISGIGLALLTLGAILPDRLLRQLHVQRLPIHPVSAGEALTVELVIQNRSNQLKSLLQIRDMIPRSLGQPIQQSVEMIPANQAHHFIYSQTTPKRGIYRWHTVEFRTGAPIGLFWCRRAKQAKATAVVYPTVLPLTQCPLIDEMGRDRSLQFNSDRCAQSATEGLTRSLRPYRWGDPTRLVHWRTSARYGELRVRELEIFTGGQELIICLDNGVIWQSSSLNYEIDAHEFSGRQTSPNRISTPENSSRENSGSECLNFEQAVVAAASLYFYACHQNLNVKIWTADTGLIHGNQVVLETLATTSNGTTIHYGPPPTIPLLWLTQNPESLSELPTGSRWILWGGNLPDPNTTEAQTGLSKQGSPGILINSEQSLQKQLQKSLMIQYSAP